jgi:hypothetical protein
MSSGSILIWAKVEVMSSAKDLVLRPIERKEADALVKRVHYSGKVVNNSQIHIGAFWNGKLEGAMQFGPSLDKSKLVGLVQGTGWNEFIELNRMAFSDALPRNSESRAIAIAMKILKKHAPHLKWVISFADATQCGDGTIYRASGFVLTGINKNTQVWKAPTGETFSRTSLTDNRSHAQQAKARMVASRVQGEQVHEKGGASMKQYIDAGFKPLQGYQLRYLYFLDPTARQRLTVPILPFSEIERLHAGMYKGQSLSRAVSIEGDALSVPTERGRVKTITALQSEEVAHA